MSGAIVLLLYAPMAWIWKTLRSLCLGVVILFLLHVIMPVPVNQEGRNDPRFAHMRPPLGSYSNR